LVGNDIGNIDMARWQIKSPFERQVVTQFDAQVAVNCLLSEHNSTVKHNGPVI